MARHLCLRDLPVSAWKNGAGSTTEIAAFPQGAGFDDFGWRISLATIARNAPFSSFPGIERSLAVIAAPESGLLLQVDGDPVRLDATCEPLRFPGEAVVTASVDAASTDFNVMTRRGKYTHRLERVTVAPGATREFERRGDATLLFFAAGQGELHIASDRSRDGRTLTLFDTLLLDDDDPRRWRIDAPAGATLLVAEIFYVQA
jgi:environmental stress-induced protein Ves